jgi:hypothetical protein
MNFFFWVIGGKKHGQDIDQTENWGKTHAADGAFVKDEIGTKKSANALEYLAGGIWFVAEIIEVVFF